MNINEFGSGGPERIPNGIHRIGAPHIQFSKSVTAEKIKSLGTNQAQHARDPEVIQYLNQLNESPDIRAEKLAEVKARLASGEYFTRQVAEQTAQAILR